MKRIITAAILLPLLLLYLIELPSVYFMWLLLLVCLLSLIEFYRMAGLTLRMQAVSLPIGLAVVMAAYLDKGLTPHLLLAGGAAFFVVRLFVSRQPENALKDSGTALIGLIYIPGLLTYQIALRGAGLEYLFLLYGAVWTSDSLALYTGKWLGRHKLYPEMSPNKTVEGALGSLAGGILAALILNYFYGFVTLIDAVVLGLTLSAAGQIGDLIESMFKRDAKVKDSGSLFPGHGGILDKIDASLLAGPALFYVLKVL